MARLDFFSSPIGLGHVTRDVAIAGDLKGISLRFVTGSSAAQFLKRNNFDVEDVYNPPQFVVENGSLKNPARWLWNYYQYYKQCKEHSKRIIQTDMPDLVVGDEDFASLTVAQEMGIPTVLITDVLETHFTKGVASLVEKKMNGSMKEIVRKCDAVIIPEIGTDRDNIRRVGPIVRQTDRSRKELRQRFSFDKKTILVSIGGTDAGAFLIEKVLEAVPRIKIDADVVIVSGPSLKKKFGASVRDMGFVDNMHELVFASDVLVSLAGKSTIDEANAYGTPGIFIPIRGHFEQEDNAREMGFSFDDINRLDDLILEKLGQGRNSVTNGGVAAASSIIRRLI